ncbi:protein usg [Novosphingobium endophyticum]|uniref:Protein usg n=1 Tax=Novosphingobium endophyticum TaxID=1955250 RepID=A0A916TP79_9SPHN|nr:usg protein [Novosphingobium endophyticum]GGB88618.1 protein usg [Novosphingobium endophyticum]
MAVRTVGSDSDFLRQLEGYGLSTIEVHYFLPDHPALLQLFAFQQYDIAPKFPVLRDFLDYWRREIEGPLHSVRVAHKHLIGPQEWRAVDGIISIH